MESGATEQKHVFHELSIPFQFKNNVINNPAYKLSLIADYQIGYYLKVYTASMGGKFGKPGEWHRFYEKEGEADTVLDRSIHQSHRIELRGESMRRKRKNQE